MKGIKIFNIPLLPPPKFSAITLFPFIFINKKTRKWKTVSLRKVLLNHERIHLYQQLELLIVFFYVFYCFEFFIRFVQYKADGFKAYKNISFEREAYENEGDSNYLKNRKLFNWIEYI